MPVSRPVLRSLLVVGLLVGGVLAAVGGLALRTPGVVAVGVAGLLAGLTAAAIAHDTPARTLRATVEAGALATAGTVGALLVVSGMAVLLGAPVTVGLLAAVLLAGPANASLTVLRWEGDGSGVLVSFNDTGHLA